MANLVLRLAYPGKVSLKCDAAKKAEPRDLMGLKLLRIAVC